MNRPPMREIQGDLLGDEALGISWSDINPISHLTTRARQLGRLASFARRAGRKIDPISFLANRIPGGGGGGGAPAPAPPAADEAEDDSTEGTFFGGRRFGRRRFFPRRSAMMGFGLANLNPFHRAAVTDAAQAVKSGELTKQHLAQAGALAKAGRAGNDKALIKIAKVTQAARRGDPNAKKAHKALTLAQTLQTRGRYVRPSRGSHLPLSSTYQAGVATIRT